MSTLYAVAALVVLLVVAMHPRCWFRSYRIQADITWWRCQTFNEPLPRAFTLPLLTLPVLYLALWPLTHGGRRFGE